MPNVNGWSTLKAIRGHELFQQIPVYMYSTSSNDRDRKIADDRGASGFFTKPYRFEEVQAIARQVIMKHREQESTYC
ncbi:hypothetical protein DQQ10_25090 [Pseudochryseolinea flava]|uniref:Response regulatory domain-containing protein n=2 Tax=Pseudochryseolinea flava TaxID=2059302 RepID=A0A364XV42_9BACT|nr:hypothetical protein DQQ10_25090 [Pseudochryseolinea flava]